MPPPPLRPAGPDDILDLARLQIASWRAAYAGLIAPATLDGLDFARAAIRWQRAIDDGLRVLVAAEPALLGFITMEKDEISMLYVAPDRWRRGIGRRLLQAALASLKEQGRGEAGLWVLSGNARARAFYQAEGGRLTASGLVRVGTQELPQVRYVWNLAAPTVPEG